MEYYVKSVVPIIESNYDKFTTVERNIADFFIQNRKKVDFSAKSIAGKYFLYQKLHFQDLQKNVATEVTGNLSISMKKHLLKSRNLLQGIPG